MLGCNNAASFVYDNTLFLFSPFLNKGTKTVSLFKSEMYHKMYLFSCDKFEFTICRIFGGNTVNSSLYSIGVLTLSHTNYEVTDVEVKANLVNSGFHTELRIGNWEYVFWFDRTPKSKVVTSNKSFILDLNGIIWTLKVLRIINWILEEN